MQYEGLERTFDVNNTQFCEDGIESIQLKR